LKKKLALITDATCDLPRELIKEFNIIVLPIPISFPDEGGKQYTNLTIDEFFQKLEEQKELPSSGIPSPKAFEDCFKKALEIGEEAIMLCVAKELSALHEKAVIFSKQVSNEKITIIDSRVTTHSLGLLVLKTAKLIEEGLGKEEIINIIQKEYIPNIHGHVYVESLNFMKRSGRISRLQYFVGELLQLKPLLTIKEGKVIPLGRKRGRNAIYNSLLRFGEEQIKMIPENEYLVIGHSRNKLKAEKLAQHFKSIIGDKIEILIWEIGPTLGVHIGPGALSLLWIGKAKKVCRGYS
jgi:DegV family protein with EDD domain